MTDNAAAFEAFAPPALVALGAVVVVLVDALTRGAGVTAPGRQLAAIRQMLLGLSSGVFILLALIVAGFNLLTRGDRVAVANDMLVADAGTHFAMVVICSSALVVLWFASSGPEGSGVRRSEFKALLLFSLAGCLAVVCAGHFVMLVVTIELASLTTIALVALDRNRERSLEASTRLWVVLGFAGAVTLYGVALVYGVTSDLSFAAAGAVDVAAGGDEKRLGVGLVLVMAGMLTRLGIAPFHHWLPNVGDGASPVAAGWGTCVLVGSICFATANLVDTSAVMEIVGLDRVLAAFAMLSLVLGSWLALVQSSVKRLLAYGGVAHAGLFLSALAVGNQAKELAATAALFEVATFVVMQLGAFGVLSVLTRERSGGVQLGEFVGLASRSPILAAAFAVCLLGLAGFPGTIGFIARFQIMQVMIASENIALALVVAAATVVLFAAYLRIAIAMYMLRGVEVEMPPTPLPATLALLVCVFATLVFGIAPAGGLLPVDLLEITRFAATPR